MWYLFFSFVKIVDYTADTAIKILKAIFDLIDDDGSSDVTSEELNAFFDDLGLLGLSYLYFGSDPDAPLNILGRLFEKSMAPLFDFFQLT